MKQLTFIKARKLAWWDVAEPVLQGPREALVRPFVVARCDGDALFLRHDITALLRVGAALHVVAPELGSAATDPFKSPIAYGHECVAEVIAVGSEVRDHAVGDVVIVPWSVSCGACAPCGRGLTSHCASNDTHVAAYGFGKDFGTHGGMVSDLVRVPHADAMLVPVPPAVDPLAVASASDNMPDGFRAVGPAWVLCTACAFYLRRGTQLPLWSMYMNSTTLHVGIAHPRAHIPAVLDLIEHRGFDPTKLDPIISSWDDAPRSLLERATKVIVQRKRVYPGAASG